MASWKKRRPREILNLPFPGQATGEKGKAAEGEKAKAELWIIGLKPGTAGASDFDKYGMTDELPTDKPTDEQFALGSKFVNCHPNAGSRKYLDPRLGKLFCKVRPGVCINISSIAIS